MSKTGKTTLNEVMGKHGEKFASRGLELHDLPELLGEGMPKLEFHTLGRIRLIRALRNRFGNHYRSVPGVQQVMQKFDHQAKIELQHHEIRKRLGRKPGE
jgi:hypothetical protein